MNGHHRVAYLGNFGATHSTENHVARAFTANGHTVYPLQEDKVESWEILRDWCRTGNWPGAHGQPTFVLRTRTWERPDFKAHETMRMLADSGVPTIGFHLDRWWGLPREQEVATQAFFKCGLVITADGGHAQNWVDAGVNHMWLPPGVSRAECLRTPMWRAEHDGLEDKVVFVGSWQGYHPEWPWRMQLIAWLEFTYGDRFVAFPKPNQPAVRGQALADLYGTGAVFVGDSCLVGAPSNYWSDRIPETLGRGGMLVHPWVDGLETHFGPEHLATFPIPDFDALKLTIDHYLNNAEDRIAMADAGQKHVLANHTYEVRVDQIIKAGRDLVGWKLT